jgi:hypothetical protein
MRAAILIALLVPAGVFAQLQEATGACQVAVGTVEVNEAGQLVKPVPSPEQCGQVADMLDKLQSMDPREFRRIVSREAIPGNVYTSITRFGTFGGPWSTGGLPRSDLPNLKHAVSWLTDKLVIIVSEGEDFSGPTTTVVIADLESQQVCSYPNWPDDSDPRRISVREIQQILSGGLRGDRPIPTCNLKPLVVD